MQSKFKSSDFRTMTDARRAYRAAGIKLTKPVVTELEIAVGKHARRVRSDAKIESGRYLPGGSAFNANQAEREKFAVNVGRAVHGRIAELYKSQYADVEYGVGGRLVYGNGIYAKSYKYSAKYHMAGARIEGAEIVLENHKGVEVLRVPMPPRCERARICFDAAQQTGAFLQGDLWGVKKREGVYERFALRKTGVEKIGYAVVLERMAEPNELKNTATRDSRIKYYEHGKTLKACAAELAQKNELAARKWNEYEERERLAKASAEERAKMAVMDKKAQRVAKLIARICGRLQVEYSDARAVGYCEAGIKAWAQRHGFDISQPTTAAAVLAADATASFHNPRRVVEYAAKRCALQLIERRAV